MNHQALRAVIEAGYESRQALTAATAGAELKEAVEAAIGLLGNGALRVAEPMAGGWQVNEWLKKDRKSTRLNSSH